MENQDCRAKNPYTSDEVDQGIQPQPSEAVIVRVWRKPAFAIGAGAIIGTNLRFLAGALLGQDVPSTFPVGTLLVNLGGSLLLGLAHALFAAYRPLPQAVPLLVSVGVLGGLTTFSTFSLETVQLIEAGRMTDAMLYQGLSLAGAMLAVCLGVLLGRSICSLLDRARRA